MEPGLGNEFGGEPALTTRNDVIVTWTILFLAVVVYVITHM